MPQPNPQIPLVINIFWQDEDHEQSEIARKYADRLYDFFNRNTADPLDRYLEIPVFLFPAAPEQVQELRLEQCRYTLNIFLISDLMVMDKGGKWNFFLKNCGIRYGDKTVVIRSSRDSS